LNIYITIETLNQIRISGSSELICNNHFNNLNDLELRISGSGRMSLDADVRNINSDISGSGGLFMKGTADQVDFSISGSGSVNAYELMVVKANVRISGSGGIEINVQDKLDAHISGSGNVRYMGDPKVNSSVSGSGSVRSR
jgi:hypothetical protein